MIRPGDFLLSAWTLLSVIALLLNDHILKWTFGNAITGKLSDVAGVFLLPLLILALAEAARKLIGRRYRSVRWPASRGETLAVVAFVAAGFAAVKTLGPIGDAYEYAVGLLRKILTASTDPATPIIVYRDATDLVVLPVLVGSYLLVRHYRLSTWGRPTSRPATPPETSTPESVQY